MRMIICVLVFLGVSKTLQGQPTAPEGLSELDQNLRIQFGPDYPVGRDPRAEIPVSQRLKADANDAFAIRKYAANIYDGVNTKVRTVVTQHASEGIERITGEVGKILPDAEKSLDDLESFLQSLPAETRAAKAAIAGAEAYLSTSRENLEVQRTSLEVFRKRLLAKPGDAMRIGYWRERLQFEFLVLINIDPFEAANLIADANEVLAVAEKAVARDEKEYSLASMSPVWQLDKTRDTLASFEATSREAVDELHHYFELVGMDALPLEVDAWVNGGPHNLEDIQGKVVLLNYFFAQHPPCVDSLPELCDWQSLYGDEGLIVIGVTPHQNLRWNSETKKAMFDRRRPKTPTDREEELKTLKNFSKEHRLNFPIAVLNKKAFNRHWGVNRFPDLPGIVVIDRGKKVHTVRRRKNEHDGSVINKALDALLLRNNEGARETTDTPLKSNSGFGDNLPR